ERRSVACLPPRTPEDREHFDRGEQRAAAVAQLRAGRGCGTVRRLGELLDAMNRDDPDRVDSCWHEPPPAAGREKWLQTIRHPVVRTLGSGVAFGRRRFDGEETDAHIPALAAALVCGSRRRPRHREYGRLPPR